jgi:hypothetical protein
VPTVLIVGGWDGVRCRDILIGSQVFSLGFWSCWSRPFFFYDFGAESAWGHPNTRPEVRLNYHRFVVYPFDRNNMVNVHRVLGWTNTSRVLVYQCGFGWPLEVLQTELGIASAIGIQLSAYIQNNKLLNEDTDVRAAVEATGLVTNGGDGLTLFNAFRHSGNPRSLKAVDVLNEDLATPQSRSTVRTRAGGPGSEILTYGILSSLEDSEIAALLDRLNRLNPTRVSHFVYTNAGPPFANRTLSQWKAVVGAHTVIEAGTFNVQ